MLTINRERITLLRYLLPTTTGIVVQLLPPTQLSVLFLSFWPVTAPVSVDTLLADLSHPQVIRNSVTVTAEWRRHSFRGLLRDWPRLLLPLTGGGGGAPSPGLHDACRSGGGGDSTEGHRTRLPDFDASLRAPCCEQILATVTVTDDAANGMCTLWHE